ncbi:MAG: hypothetical protein MUC87_07240 [Bacteroidia bacterium]|jgi:hypothetical protein|nr:hypothetical protein [Bacteroidia bacterium]
MKNAFFFLVLTVLWVACSDSKPTHSNTDSASSETSSAAQAEPAQFAAFFSDFYTQAHQPGNTTALDAFVSGTHGIWVVEAGGAMPTFTHYTQLHTIPLGNGSSLFPLLTKFSEVIIDTLPLRDCDKPSLFNKEGCFAQQVNTFAQHKIWTSAGLPLEQRNALEKLAALIDYTVVDTNGFVYYFIKENGKWHPAVIDLRRPCGA